MTVKEKLIALRNLRNKLITLGLSDEVNNLEEIFPELKKSNMNEDENTKKELFRHLKEGADGYEPAGSSEDYAKWLDWLERQFKQIHYASDAPIGQKATGEVVYIEDVKSTKPKFERGCWITNGRYVKLIVGIDTKDDMPYYYMFKDGTTKYIDEIDKKYHLWTIEDAKDGDIIAFNIDENLNHRWIGIFKERPDLNLYDNKYCTCKFHCLINFINEEPEFEIGGVWNVDITDVQPATDEQISTLFDKINEEGLMWDDINKVLMAVKVKQANAKFNVNDTIHYNGLGHNEYVIKEVHYPTHYVNELGEKMDMSYTDAHFTFIGHVDNSEDNRHEWSKEDEEIINKISIAIATHYSCDTAVKIENWLKYLKDNVQPQLKQEWNEEDERNLNGIIDEIKANKNQAPDYDLATYERFLSWLKDIKNRMQPKQKWSENDEKMLKDIISDVKFEGYNNDMLANSYRKINWLNDIKRQIQKN